MKSFFKSRFLIAIIFFFVGFFSNPMVTRVAQRAYYRINGTDDRLVRFPVNPNDFDHQKLMNAAQKMQRDIVNQSGSLENDGSVIERKEDEQFVYYDIRLSTKEQAERQLRVNVKDGMISISENSKNTRRLREFSIDPGLDESHAKVLTLSDKITIQIPKLK